MKKRFRIFVEGDADKKFLSDYYHHLFQEKAPQYSINHTGDLTGEKTGGYKKLSDEINIREMRINADQDGVNLVIFDADNDIEARRKELEAIKEQYHVEFELFLLPNDKDTGALEDMLEQIINPVNQPIFKCWENYEKELIKQEIPGRTPPPLTTPAKKTKIYGYLEALLGESKTQKNLIKEANRNYRNAQHWNLDVEYLKPLKEFLNKHLLEQYKEIDK
ncbi:MAG: hypothetical protein IJV33_07685 [Bacteroidaceae bacterium]|nr:hypothetical protein [Bacteroidaceae bacterium]